MPVSVNVSTVVFSAGPLSRSTAVFWIPIAIASGTSTA
jgi:hypothetical protein